MSLLNRCLLVLSIFTIAACGSTSLDKASISRAHELNTTGLQGPVYIKARSFQADDETFGRYASHISKGFSRNGVEVAETMNEARYVALIDHTMVRDHHKLGSIGETTDHTGGFTARENEKFLILRIYDLEAKSTDALPSVYEAIVSMKTNSLGDDRVDSAITDALFANFYSRVHNVNHASMTNHWSESGMEISE